MQCVSMFINAFQNTLFYSRVFILCLIFVLFPLAGCTYMQEKLPTYIINVDDDDELGVDRLSLVARPAVQTNFIALSEAEKVHRIQLLKSNLAQQMLYGVVLKPDQLIYRRDDDGSEYNITFPKDQIVKIAQRYLKNGHQNKVNIEHGNKTISASIVESWITVDTDKDKIKAVGLAEDLPIGSWCVGIKVDQLADWEAYVESGLVNGFSLEGNFDHIIKLKQETMTKQEQELQSTQLEIEIEKKKQELSELRAKGQQSQQQMSDQKQDQDSIGLFTRIARAFGLSHGKGSTQKPVMMSDDQALRIVRPEAFTLGGKQWTKEITLFAQGGRAKVLCQADGTTVQLNDGKYQLTTGGHVEVVGGIAMIKLAVTPTYTAEDGKGIYVDTENENMAYWVMEDGSTEAIADGSYKTNDGKIVVITGGKFVEVKEEEMKEDQAMESPSVSVEMPVIDKATLEQLIAGLMQIAETQQEMKKAQQEMKKAQDEEMKKVEEMRQHLSQTTGAKWQTAGVTEPKPTQTDLSSQDGKKKSLEQLAEEARQEMKPIRRK